jgi:hypothetical protein
MILFPSTRAYITLIKYVFIKLFVCIKNYYPRAKLFTFYFIVLLVLLVVLVVVVRIDVSQIKAF